MYEIIKVIYFLFAAFISILILKKKIFWNEDVINLLIPWFIFLTWLMIWYIIYELMLNFKIKNAFLLSISIWIIIGFVLSIIYITWR